MKVFKKIFSRTVLLVLQGIVSVVLLVSIVRIGIIPSFYTVIIGLLLFLLWMMSTFLIKDKHHRRKRKKQLFGKFISVLLSVLMIICSVVLNKSYATLDDVTNSQIQSVHYAIVVLKSSGINDLSDIKNESIEYCLQYDEQRDMNQVIVEAKNKESSIQYDLVMTYPQLADDLYNNTVHAILINTAYNGMFEEKHPDFENEVKEIWTSDVETKVKDFSTRVSVTNTPFTIYISGIDTYGNVSTVSRSDVNMILTVNPNTKKVLLTSIPRDYYVTLANLNQKDKLTHSGLAGTENTVKTMSQFIGMNINYYARVNFTSLVTMVDALGGINVSVDRDFQVGQYVFKVGMQEMTGEEALVYARERHSFEDGDNVRVKHQQDILTAMLDKMMSPAIITNYASVLNAINGCFETNMQTSDITDLIKMQINDRASWNFLQKQFAGNGVMQQGGAYMPESTLYYMIPDEQSVNENINAIKDVLYGK